MHERAAPPPGHPLARSPRLPGHSLHEHERSHAGDQHRSIKQTWEHKLTRWEHEIRGDLLFKGDEGSRTDGLLVDYPEANLASHLEPTLFNQTSELHLRWPEDPKHAAVYGPSLAVPAFFRAAHLVDISSMARTWVRLPHKSATALCYSQDGSTLWVGDEDGCLSEIDTRTGRVLRHELHAHKGARLLHIWPCRRTMLTVDSAGRLVVWRPPPGGLASLASAEASTMWQVVSHPAWVGFAADKIWCTQQDEATHVVHVFDPTGDGDFFSPLLKLPAYLGSPSAISTVPRYPGIVFLGHTSGHVSAWDVDDRRLLCAHRVAREPVTALAGPAHHLWIGFNSGFVAAFSPKNVDITAGPRHDLTMRCKKVFKAHDGAVTSLSIDLPSLRESGQLRVVSTGADKCISFWDGLLHEDWLKKRMARLVGNYSRAVDAGIAFFTFNVDAATPHELKQTAKNRKVIHDFLATLQGPLRRPAAIHFGLQETLDLSSKRTQLVEALQLFEGHAETMPQYRSWRKFISKEVASFFAGDDRSYRLVKCATLDGLCSLLFVDEMLLQPLHGIAGRSPFADLEVDKVNTGYFAAHWGNKGAIILRFVINDSSFCILNCHLASGKQNPEHRVRDIIEVLESKSRFPKASSASRYAFSYRADGTSVGEHEYIFVCGDLNFRLLGINRKEALAAIEKRDLATLKAHDELLLHIAPPRPLPPATQPITKPAAEDESAPLAAYQRKPKWADLDSGVNAPAFQLEAFHEMPIDFLPTYKYDNGTDQYDTSKKQRTPAWCDRVLWHCEPFSKLTALKYWRLETDVSDHRPVAFACRVKVKIVDPFELNATLQEVEKDGLERMRRQVAMAQDSNPHRV